MLRAMFHGVPAHLIDRLLDGRAITEKGDVRALLAGEECRTPCFFLGLDASHMRQKGSSFALDDKASS
jgi:hypothetical protein